MGNFYSFLRLLRRSDNFLAKFRENPWVVGVYIVLLTSMLMLVLSLASLYCCSSPQLTPLLSPVGTTPRLQLAPLLSPVGTPPSPVDTPPSPVGIPSFPSWHPSSLGDSRVQIWSIKPAILHPPAIPPPSPQGEGEMSRPPSCPPNMGRGGQGSATTCSFNWPLPSCCTPP